MHPPVNHLKPEPVNFDGDEDILDDQINDGHLPHGDQNTSCNIGSWQTPPHLSLQPCRTFFNLNFVLFMYFLIDFAIKSQNNSSYLFRQSWEPDSPSGTKLKVENQ